MVSTSEHKAGTWMQEQKIIRNPNQNPSEKQEGDKNCNPLTLTFQSRGGEWAVSSVPPSKANVCLLSNLA